MKLEQFIGIFPNAINNDLCFEFVKWYNEVSKHGITMSTMQDMRMSGNERKDTSIHIPATLPIQCFPRALCQPLWKKVSKCLDIYQNNYHIERDMNSHGFKAHRVLPVGGYHIWHHEHDYENPFRILAWMIILEAPNGGGETEFLHQSMRIEPKVGQLTIWPAGFTHKHRGNPPLEGQKTYLTGWFSLTLPQKRKYG